MSTLIASILALIGTCVTAWFTYKNNKDSDQKKQLLKQKEEELRANISKTEEQELITAMGSNITDVPGLRLKLENYRKQLKKIIGLVLLILTLPMSGCVFFQKEQPVIVGERVFYMKEGQQMTVPSLKDPAKQWYLIDDVAMLKVLGIDRPIEKTVTGKTK